MNRRAAPEVFEVCAGSERELIMFNIRKLLVSSGVMAVLVAIGLLLGQLTAPSALAAGPILPDVNWGSGPALCFECE